MKKTIHVSTSPLSNRIYAGTLIANNTRWGANKQDVTDEACGAVAQHVLNTGVPVQVRNGSELLYEISVVDISKRKPLGHHIWPGFSQDNGKVCPVCRTNRNVPSVLVPKPGTEHDGIMEAGLIHEVCYRLLLDMGGE